MITGEDKDDCTPMLAYLVVSLSSSEAFESKMILLDMIAYEEG